MRSPTVEDSRERKNLFYILKADGVGSRNKNFTSQKYPNKVVTREHSP